LKTIITMINNLTDMLFDNNIYLDQRVQFEPFNLKLE